MAEQKKLAEFKFRSLDGKSSVVVPVRFNYVGHKDAITALALLPDGKHFLSGTEKTEGLIKLWNLEKGECLQTYDYHYDRITAIVPLPAEGASCNSFISASRSHSNSIAYWDLSTGEVIQEFAGHKYGVRVLKLLPAEMYFLSGSDDDTLKLWDIENITLIRTFEGHKGDIVDIEVLAGNEQFLSASEDNTARLWDLKTGKVLRTYTDAQDVRIVKLLEDSKHFISISYPFLVKLRSLESDEEEVIYSNEDFLPLWASRFSDSNQIVISVQAEERHKLFFLDADTREVFISDNYNENLWAIEVLPGSDMALSGCTDDIVLLDFSALRHFKRKHRKIDG